MNYQELLGKKFNFYGKEILIKNSVSKPYLYLEYSKSGKRCSGLFKVKGKDIFIFAPIGYKKTYILDVRKKGEVTVREKKKYYVTE